jgi:amidohydrolase
MVQRPETWGEDFSFFAEKVPGVFAIVGASYDDGREIYSNHNSRFDWDENAMKNGMALLVGSAVKFLNVQ